MTNNNELRKKTWGEIYSEFSFLLQCIKNHDDYEKVKNYVLENDLPITFNFHFISKKENKNYYLTIKFSMVEEKLVSMYNLLYYNKIFDLLENLELKKINVYKVKIDENKK